MQTKKMGVVISGAEGTEIKDVQVMPGATARDVLSRIGLDGGQLSSGGNSAPFASGDNVYEKVQDGAKLFASKRAEVGK